MLTQNAKATIVLTLFVLLIPLTACTPDSVTPDMSDDDHAPVGRDLGIRDTLHGQHVVNGEGMRALGSQGAAAHQEQTRHREGLDHSGFASFLPRRRPPQW